MVEAPGTAPGSETLIPYNVYRHSWTNQHLEYRPVGRALQRFAVKGMKKYAMVRLTENSTVMLALDPCYDPNANRVGAILHGNARNKPIWGHYS